MSNLGFKYELHTESGENILVQSVSGARMGVMLEHIAKMIFDQRRKYGRVVLNMVEARLEDGKVLNDKKRMASLNTLVMLAAEHYTQKAGKLIVETTVIKKAGLAENLKKVLSNPKKIKKLVAELKLPDLEVGDTLLVGKFKNRKAEIKGFSTDEHGQPVAQTTKGDQKIFKPRIAKLMPGAEVPKPEPQTEAEEPKPGKSEVLDKAAADQKKKHAEARAARLKAVVKPETNAPGADDLLDEKEDLYHLHAPGQKEHGKQKLLHTKDAAQMNKGSEGFKWVKHSEWLNKQLKSEAEVMDKMGKKTKQVK